MDVFAVLEKFNLNDDVKDDIYSLLDTIDLARSRGNDYQGYISELEWYLTALRSAKIIDGDAYDEFVALIKG